VHFRLKNASGESSFKGTFTKNMFVFRCLPRIYTKKLKFSPLVFCLPPYFIRDASCIMLSIDWTPLGPRNHVLDGVQIFPRKGTLLGATLGHAYTCSLVYFPVACCLGKLFTPIVPLFTKQQNLVAALLRVVGVTTGLAESNGSLPPSL